MSDITVVVPTSAIPIHPSTEIIEACVLSIRKHLPDSDILVMCDGVRPSVEHRREQYKEYLMRLALKSLEWRVRLEVFQTHKQQAGMLKAVIDSIRTPLLMFFEHDATLDEKIIDWDAIERILLSGEANTVRFYWHETLHPEHMFFMGKRDGPFVKTTQWSSWPHVSRVDFYRRILAEYFNGDDCRMTETVLYSPVSEHSWDRFKTWIYAPEPDAIRFHHLNGRIDPKTGEKDPGEW